MRKSLLLLIIFLPLLGFAQKDIFFFRTSTKIDKLLVLPPTTSIAVIYKKSYQQHDSVLTQETFKLTSALLQKGFPDSVATIFYPSNSIAGTRMTNFAFKLNKKIKNERQVKNYILPDSIINLFDTTKVRYVFSTFYGGFTRTTNNFVNTQMTLEAANILVGLGLLPLESSALLNCFIMDLKEKNILFYERDVWRNKDPTDLKIIKIMLDRIITHCFI